MTWQPRRWAGGLLIPAALWILGTTLQAPLIATDLATSTSAALKAAGLDWTDLRDAGGRDIALAGVAPDENALAQARRTAESVWGVRRVEQASLGLLPEASPYIWSAERTATSVVLKGAVPTEAVRSRISGAAEAAFATLQIVDETKLARGAQPGFPDSATMALADLAKLEQGVVTLTGGDISIQGQALDFASFDSLTALLKALPPNIRLASAQIAPPRVSPFLWTASWKMNKLEIAGVTPAERARSDVAARAAEVFPGVALADTSRVATGAPAGDWSAAARFALDQLARMTEGEARLTDGRLTISGVGKPGFGNSQLASASGALPAGFSLAPGSIAAPAVKPYTVTIGKQGPSWTIAGYMPSEGARALLAANLHGLGASEVRDTGVIATGLPQPLDFDTVTGFMTTVLAKLDSGEAKLVDGELTVSGAASDRTVALAVAALLHGPLPAGLALKSEAISQPAAPQPEAEPPYAWSAAIAPGGLTLSGSYPDEKSHAEMIEHATRLFQGEKLIDEMKEARGASRHFMDAVFVALERLSRMEKGSASIQGEKLALHGETLLASAADQLVGAASNGLPQDWSAAAEISPPPAAPEIAAAVCQQALRELLKSGRIYFENGKADIERDGFRLLDRLTATVRRCPATKIEIAGHTDNDGSAAFNQDLSERRAYAVVDYLIRNGNVASGRLSAVGYGSSKPVASNDTDEGKARNRRIEFIVK